MISCLAQCCVVVLICNERSGLMQLLFCEKQGHGKKASATEILSDVPSDMFCALEVLYFNFYAAGVFKLRSGYH